MRTFFSQPRRLALAGKLALGLVASTSLVLLGLGILNLRLQRKQAEDLVLQSGDRIGDLIQRSTRYQMLHYDRDALAWIVSEFGREPGILHVRVFNPQGRIKFSSDPSEIDKVVYKNADVCYGCHAQGKPIVKLSRSDRTKIVNDPKQGPELAVVRAIENERSCWTAECHVHTSDQQVLGVIDTRLSLGQVDQQIAQHQRYLLLFTLLALALIIVVSVLFVWLLVHRPVKELKAGTERVAGGDLDYRIPIHSRDDLSDLAESFNKMTAELAAAHDELTSWAHTLEQRVTAKTEELGRAQRTLFQSEKLASLGRLSATVAHEVNNPLFGILTYARLMLKELEAQPPSPQRDKTAERLRVIERESRRCGDIVRDLLAFARQAPRRNETNDVRVLADRAVKLIRHKAEMQSVSIETALDENMPPVVCDAGQIQQVLLALLVNAVEAMSKGGSVRLEGGLDKTSAQVWLKIRDTGAGIPPAALPHIFEPFFTTKDNEHRTGLGLAVARSILDQHGGQIQVTSSGETGTEFTIRLPLEAPRATEAEPAGAKQ